MSSLDKLLKSFESVRVAGTQATGSKSRKSSFQSSNPNSIEEKKNSDQPKTMAYFASSISQQGQNLLRKEHSLTSRDKLALCQSVSESVISGTKMGSDSQKLISIGIETLIVLIDDDNPDVRMNADESLNRVIRSLSDNHMGKIQLELFKEIKKNGSVRCLRAALTRFGILCFHIRPQKCRAYVQNLLPYLTKIAYRPEENLQETLATCLDKVLPILGHFTNDNEVRSLLKAFLPNVTHSSPSMRRSACSSLISLCEHSRKPSFFFLWLLDSILQCLIPIRDDASSNHVIGSLLLLRSLAPYFEQLVLPVHKSLHEKFKEDHSVFNIGQALQVYELCLHYSGSKDHNVIIASLETLQALLQHLSQHLLAALTSPGGIVRSSISGDKVYHLYSRTSSESSISVTMAEEETLEIDDEGPPTIDKTPDDVQGPIPRLSSAESMDSGLETNELLEVIPKEEVDSKTSVYDDIEIGQISDCGPLLGRSYMDIGEGSLSEKNNKKKKFLHESKNVIDNGLSDEKYSVQLDERVQGNIGSLLDKDLPLKYLVRYLSWTFLLSGYPRSQVSDQTSKVSAKVLAINCLGHAISLQPSILALPLFTESQGSVKMQIVADIFLYYSHTDPLLASSVAIIIGQFLFSSLVTNEGHHLDYGIDLISINKLLNILCTLLGSSSSVTARGALTGLSICLPELLHSCEAPMALSVIKSLMGTANNSYWLVKVELCELLSNISCLHVDYLGKSGLRIHIHSSKEESRISDQYSTRILTDVFLPLLADNDKRVRGAASRAVVKIVPELLSDGDVILKSSIQFTHSGHLSSNQDLYRSLSFSSMSSDCLLPPFDKLLRRARIPSSVSSSHSCSTSLQDLVWENNERSVSRVITIISRALLSCNEKYLRLGCLELLSEMCKEYPPVLHPKAWGCDVKYSPENDTSLHIGLMSLLLTLAGESSLAGDLSAQQFILDIYAHWLAGRAVFILNDSSNLSDATDDKQSWSFLHHPQLSIVGENFVQHVLHILCVYMHLLEGITPSSRSTLVPPVAAAVLSPIKRKTSRVEDSNSHSPRGNEKLNIDDRKSKMGVRGAFTHLPAYIKLYDILKSAYTNHKMSLDDSYKEKFYGLLETTLVSLGIVLEFSSMTEFGKLTEELLQYFRATTILLPSRTIFCGQQLLKCLFGSNAIALWSHIFKSSLQSSSGSMSSLNTSFSASYRSDVVTYESLHQSLNAISLQLSSSQLKMDLIALINGKMELETLGLGLLKKKNASYGSSSRPMDKGSLSSYIRMFEPLVIKALKLYTVTSDITMQRSVLELLIHLVQIRVNYCLLDSEQIFIGYVIKQFEYIEEGQMKNCEDLIPSMFNFLVLLSYERYHSKSIIGVPKIIQLCDGLMASGQPPLSHCILALKPLVEDLFLERSHVSHSEQTELETQREVLCSMLLRLAHYHEVLHLLSIVLISTHESNKDRWRKLSVKILGVLLPMISKLQININSEASMSSVEGIMNCVCSTVYTPPDHILKSLLTSPSEIETTEGVERWVGGVLVLIRVLITRSCIDTILSRLDKLGLCMEYVRPPDMESSLTLHQSLSPKRFSKSTTDSSVGFVDPLNVTKTSVVSETALARQAFTC